jgi:hypothetical protein
VLCPIRNEKTNRTYWMRIGNAFLNRDGSTNVYLDAYPANGRLQIRDMDERDFAPRPGADDGPRGGDDGARFAPSGDGPRFAPSGDGPHLAGAGEDIPF